MDLQEIAPIVTKRIPPNMTLYFVTKRCGGRFCRHVWGGCDRVGLCECCLAKVFQTLCILAPDESASYSVKTAARLVEYCCMEISREGIESLVACLRCGDSDCECGDYLGQMEHVMAREAAFIRYISADFHVPKDLCGMLAGWLYRVMRKSDVAWRECKKYLWW